jgi:hypothetical protein
MIETLGLMWLASSSSCSGLCLPYRSAHPCGNPPHTILGDMKHLLLACCLLPSVYTLYAQTSPAPAVRPVASVRYCLLIVKQKPFGGTSLRLDFGQGQRHNPVIREDLDLAARTVARFTSVPAALGYLDGIGWECVQSSTVPPSLFAQGRADYLLRPKP